MTKARRYPRYSTQLRGKITASPVWLVVQGPTTWPFSSELIEFYSQYMDAGLNVVWSTWDDIGPSELERLQSSGINFVVSGYPEERGYGNVNLQCQSTLAGLRFAKGYNARAIMKCRADFVFTGLDQLIDRILKRDPALEKLHSFGFHKEAQCINDVFLFGSIDRMERFWELEQIQGWTERILVQEFLEEQGIPYVATPEHLSRYFGYFLGDVIELGLDVQFLKKIYQPEHPSERFIVPYYRDLYHY